MTIIYYLTEEESRYVADIIRYYQDIPYERRVDAIKHLRERILGKVLAEDVPHWGSKTKIDRFPASD